MFCANCHTPVLCNPLCTGCAIEREYAMQQDEPIMCDYCDVEAQYEIYRFAYTYQRKISSDGYPQGQATRLGIDDRIGDTVYVCEEHKDM